MIKITSIHVHEFRGIRDLKLELNGANFAACGPNGTGKSGIVDAIEFALTGSISRLSGSGTGGLSVKVHGPHVDSRDNPDKAFVTLEVTIPTLGNRKATIHRTVKAASAPVITPTDAATKQVFDHVGLHPEFVLSRRELIRYVLSEPGQRAKEVQALLRLEDIERLRAVLQKISNSLAKELPALERAERDAANNLLSALSITQLNKSSILKATNERRQTLGLPLLVDLEATSSLKDGLASPTTNIAAGRVPKIQAVADLVVLTKALAGIQSTVVKTASQSATQAISELLADTVALNAVTREELLRTALELYDGTKCPVCDTQFEPKEFMEHVSTKLDHLSAVAKKRLALEALLTPILEAVLATGTALANVIAHAKLFSPPIEVTILEEFKVALLARYQQLQKVLPLEETLTVIGALPQTPDIGPLLKILSTSIEAIPEPSKQDAARDFLVVAQERLDFYRSTRLKHVAGKQKADRAAKVYEVYADISTTELEKIYKQVEGAFSAYYSQINKEDESAFTAKLMPSIGKLGFDVDFYGRGHFPPGAYHSEGHQDGMGLCLYLALMGHLLKSNFTFAVLDDVLMSVDAGHRREVCTLLKTAFPNTQFIFTTHDEIWLRHMRTEGLIKNRCFVHFRTWSVELGPTEWDDKDVWDEINTHLKKNDVRGAAGLLRHFLEHFSKEACGRLRTQVEYRGDAQFVLSDLLPNVTHSLGDSLKKAKAAANSWKQSNVLETIGEKEQVFTAAKSKVNADQWQINAAVHFNSWADLQKSDFLPVVAGFKEFVEAFSCKDCAEMYYVTPNRGKKEAFRCGCGATNFNLIEKS